MGSLAHFSDSGESSNQEDEYESEGGDSEEHEGEDLGTLDEQLERRNNAAGRASYFDSFPAIGRIKFNQFWYLIRCN
jgi:hypothetical protein